MTGNLTVALLIGVLYAVGTYLLLQRTLTRVVLGLALLGHGANLLLLQAGGPAGLVPFVSAGSDATVSNVSSSRRSASARPIHPRSAAATTDSRYRPMLVGEVRVATTGTGVYCTLSGGRWCSTSVTTVSK